METGDPRGVRTTNLDHRHYEQVRKHKTYFHAEQASEEFEQDTRLEEVNLRDLRGEDPGRAVAAREALVRGLSEIGFVYLVDHGVDSALFDEAHRRTLELFETTPRPVKDRFLAERFGSVNQGYFPFKETTDIHPDLVEGWVFAGRAFGLDPRYDTAGELEAFWPNLDDERFFRGFYEALAPLARPLMRAILKHFGCAENLYDARLTDTLCALRLNYYPPLSDEDEKLGAARLLGHEDVTLFTLLPASEVDGLQVFNHETGRWIRLSPVPGTIILNAGDYLQRITNDRLRSSTHRVGLPTRPELRGRPRASCPLFVYLREEDTVEVLPCIDDPHYEPIQAQTFHTRITRKFYGDPDATSGDGDGNAG